MKLNKAKGNMYGFVSHTGNVIKGKCPHDCEYCYMKSFKLNKIRLDEQELQIPTGTGNFIFVGSSCDMWAKEIPQEWIYKVMEHCYDYENKYLFQSKNPARFIDFVDVFPKDIVLGTTIESDLHYREMGQSPSIHSRIRAMKFLKEHGYKTMITIEPIMDFTLPNFITLIKTANPDWVNIGADSKGHKLIEPSQELVTELINELNKFTEIKLKSNLDRLHKFA